MCILFIYDDDGREGKKILGYFFLTHLKLCNQSIIDHLRINLHINLNRKENT
jgi:hypothetical protein